MSIRIEDLKVGSVVRLASGSPKMVVTGFGPLRSQAPPQERDRSTVFVRGWSDRIGLFVAELSPDILVFPRAQAEVEE